MNEKPNHFLVLALIAGLATADLSVAEQADTNTDQVPEADLKEFKDPTILSRRVWPSDQELSYKMPPKSRAPKKLCVRRSRNAK
jgi:hypothetical protein